jgi:hypothetical protein
MKKILTFLITLLYLTSTFGIGVEAHYCGGKLRSIHFLSANHSCCCKKKAVMNKNCCKNEVKFFKVLENHENQPALKTANFYHWQILSSPVLIPMAPQVKTIVGDWFLPIERRCCKSSLFLSNRALRL